MHHRRSVIAMAASAAIATVFRPVNATAAVEAVPGGAAELTPGTWVALGDRWAHVVDMNGQLTVHWTGRYDESGQFQFDEFGTFLPGYIASDGA